jgi:uncharacterized protein (TIGR02996 family)
MTELERRLLAQIVAAPDDDSPRLVYSDWLLQRGGTDEALGHLIAHECHIARLGPDHDERLMRSHELDRLLDRYGLVRHPWFPTRWLDERRGPRRLRAGQLDLRTRRGFPAVIDNFPSLDEISSCADELFRDAPLLEVMTSNGAGDARRFAACRVFERIRTLEITGDYERDHSLGLRALVESPWWPAGLTVLTLAASTLGADGVALLAASGRLSSVQSLSLDGNGIGTKGLRALATTSSVANLRTLQLCDTAIGVASAQRLAASPHLERLERLTLGFDRYRRKRLDSDAIELLRKRFGSVLELR